MLKPYYFYFYLPFAIFTITWVMQKKIILIFNCFQVLCRQWCSRSYLHWYWINSTLWVAFFVVYTYCLFLLILHSIVVIKKLKRIKYLKIHLPQVVQPKFCFKIPTFIIHTWCILKVKHGKKFDGNLFKKVHVSLHHLQIALKDYRATQLITTLCVCLCDLLTQEVLHWSKSNVADVVFSFACCRIFITLSSSTLT